MTICICSVLAALVLGCDESGDLYYSDFNAAMSDGAIGNARPIPDIMPRSSREIQVRYEVDSSRAWLRFKFDRGDVDSLINHVQELTTSELQNVTFVSPRNLKWWPEELSNNTFKGSVSDSNLKIYRYYKVTEYEDGHREREASYFAVHWPSSTAYYWIP